MVRGSRALALVRGAVITAVAALGAGSAALAPAAVAPVAAAAATVAPFASGHILAAGNMTAPPTTASCEKIGRAHV